MEFLSVFVFVCWERLLFWGGIADGEMARFGLVVEQFGGR